MRCVRLLLFLLLITPLAAGAAGFAKESVFLSKLPVTEGETVFIHAIVTNPSTTTFEGDVVFKDGEQKIGAVAVTISPGGAQAVSVSWQPSAGSYHITTELTASNGAVAESKSATFAVQEQLNAESNGTTTASVESSEQIRETIASISPQAAEVVTPVFTTIDSLREKAVGALDGAAGWAKEKAATPKGIVAGENTEESKGIVETVTQLVATLLLFLFSILKSLVSSAGVFYPLIALLFFYMLWRLFKKMRRPRYG